MMLLRFSAVILALQWGYGVGAVAVDGRGNTWQARTYSGAVAYVQQDPRCMSNIELPLGPVGIAIADDGAVWSSGLRASLARATRAGVTNVWPLSKYYLQARIYPSSKGTVWVVPHNPAEAPLLEYGVAGPLKAIALKLNGGFFSTGPIENDAIAVSNGIELLYINLDGRISRQVSLKRVVGELAFDGNSLVALAPGQLPFSKELVRVVGSNVITLATLPPRSGTLEQEYSISASDGSTYVSVANDIYRYRDGKSDTTGPAPR